MDSQQRNRFAVPMMCLVMALAEVDNHVFLVMMQPIKEDLSLSDTAMGLLGGGAFALFYATFGIPLAHLADQVNRRNLVAGLAGIWSGFAVATSAAVGFFTLAAARFGVSVGYAGFLPAAQSLLADCIDSTRRGRVFAFLTASGGVGVFLGIGLGGFLSDQFGWRLAFIIVGLPGILIALLVRASVSEPERHGAYSAASIEFTPTGVATAFRSVIAVPSFLYLVLGGAFNGMLARGFTTWAAAYLMRSHDLSATQAGIVLALTAGLGAIAGTVTSGFLTDSLVKKDDRWFAWLPAIAMLVSVPAYLAAIGATSLPIVIAGLALLAFTTGINIPPTFAAAQRLVAPNRRAMAIAVFGLALAVIGTGAGPVFVGIASDLLYERWGSESLRAALLLVFGANVLAAIFFWLAGRRLRDDLDRWPKDGAAEGH